MTDYATLFPAYLTYLLVGFNQSLSLFLSPYTSRDYAATFTASISFLQLGLSLIRTFDESFRKLRGCTYGRFFIDFVFAFVFHYKYHQYYQYLARTSGRDGQKCFIRERPHKN